MLNYLLWHPPIISKPIIHLRVYVRAAFRLQFYPPPPNTQPYTSIVTGCDQSMTSLLLWWYTPEDSLFFFFFNKMPKNQTHRPRRCRACGHYNIRFSLTYIVPFLTVAHPHSICCSAWDVTCTAIAGKKKPTENITLLCSVLTRVNYNYYAAAA